MSSHYTCLAHGSRRVGFRGCVVGTWHGMEPILLVQRENPLAWSQPRSVPKTSTRYLGRSVHLMDIGVERPTRRFLECCALTLPGSVNGSGFLHSLLRDTGGFGRTADASTLLPTGRITPCVSTVHGLVKIGDMQLSAEVTMSTSLSYRNYGFFSPAPKMQS